MKLWGYEFCEDWRISLSLPMSTSHKTHLSIPSPLKLLTTYLSQLRNIKQPKPTFTLTEYSLPTYLVWGTHFILFLDIITGYHKIYKYPTLTKWDPLQEHLSKNAPTFAISENFCFTKYWSFHPPHQPPIIQPLHISQVYTLYSLHPTQRPKHSFSDPSIIQDVSQKIKTADVFSKFGN